MRNRIAAGGAARSAGEAIGVDEKKNAGAMNRLQTGGSHTSTTEMAAMAAEAGDGQWMQRVETGLFLECAASNILPSLSGSSSDSGVWVSSTHETSRERQEGERRAEREDETEKENGKRVLLLGGERSTAGEKNADGKRERESNERTQGENMGQ